MVHAVALDRVAERAHHVLLADDLIEGQRAVAAVKRRLAGHLAESTDASDSLGDGSRSSLEAERLTR